MKSPLAVLQCYLPHDGTLDSAFTTRCQHRQDALFLVQGKHRWTWSEFGKRYRQLAAALAERGIQKGDRVALVSRNDAAHVLALFALARLGAIMVPINPEFGAREMDFALKHADIQAVFVESSRLEQVRSITQTMTHQPWLSTLDAPASDPHSLEALINGAPAKPSLPDGIKADDTCVIIYTSGTTGFPKGVMHSQQNLVTAGEANVARLHLQPDDRIMIILPFFHMNALFYSVGGALAAGASMIVVPRFSASAFWQTAADNGATVVNIIEAIGTILVSRDPAEYRPDHRLRAVYGVRQRAAPLFRERFGIPHLFSGFGMTEVPGVTCNPYDSPNKPGSMGIVSSHPDPARPWARCRVVDDHGNDVPPGELGELWVSTPIVMQGYFRDPEQTRDAFHGEWLKTGDLVRCDEDGFYFHVSRKKDIIRRRGENIAAAELEAVINEHPSVFESAALAVPSELGEDDILIAVAPQAEASLSAQDIADWCRARLSAIKTPRYIVFLPALPHTPTHKIAKNLLREDPRLKTERVDLQA